MISKVTRGPGRKRICSEFNFDFADSFKKFRFVHRKSDALLSPLKSEHIIMMGFTFATHSVQRLKLVQGHVQHFPATNLHLNSLQEYFPVFTSGFASSGTITVDTEDPDGSPNAS
jgi:hypothetical protein